MNSGPSATFGIMFSVTNSGSSKRLTSGDQVNITVHEGGAITLTPVRRTASPEAVTGTIRKTAKDYRRTLRRLA